MSHEDYDYSDSFISDDESSPPYKRKTKKFQTDSKPNSFKSVYTSSSTKAGRGKGTMRGRGGKNMSRNSNPNDSRPNGAVGRMLSAKNHKLNELRNQIEDMQVALRDVQEENKLLKKMQYRQEKALHKYEDQESDLPQIIQKHQNEVRTLKESLRKTREKYERTDRYLRDAEDELDKVKSKLKRYKGLVDSKSLLDREELQKKNQQLEIDYEEKEVRTKDLEKHINHLNKNHRHELGIEIARNRELQKQLDRLREDNENLERTIKEKDKEIQIKNIYANRSKAPSRLPASYGGTPLDTPPPRIRKRVPSLHELTPREKAKAFENKRRDDERKQKEKKASGDGPKMAFQFSDDARHEYDYNRRNNNSQKEYSSNNYDTHLNASSSNEKSYDYSPRGRGSKSKRENQSLKPPLPSGNKGYGFKYGNRPEQQENAQRERERKEQEEAERKRQERERREQEEWDQRERERREREERERQEHEEADWKLSLERDRLKREQDDRDREEREHRERQERERRERERKEQERRAKEDRERMEMDSKLQEERRKKDELLAKLKKIDDKATSNTESKDKDTFFITSGNTDTERSVSDKQDTKRGKDPVSTGFLFNAPTKENTGSVVGSAGSSKRSYSFTKPIENLHSGKPSHDDVSVPYIEKKKQQKNKNDLDEFGGGYQPSFTSSRTQKSSPKKSENSVMFNSDFGQPKNQRKNKLMSDLFGEQTKSSRKDDDDDDDLFKPSTNRKTVQSSNRSSFPWEDDTTTTKKEKSKRENSTSALFGGGTALVDDDVHKSDNSKLLPRRSRQPTTTFHSKPIVTAGDNYDDDIEEVML